MFTVDLLFNGTSLCTTEGKAEQVRCTATVSVLLILPSVFNYSITQGCYFTGILKAFLFWTTVYSEMKI